MQLRPVCHRYQCLVYSRAARHGLSSPGLSCPGLLCFGLSCPGFHARAVALLGSRRMSMRGMRGWIALIVLAACVVALAAAVRSGVLDTPVNSPYEAGAESTNTLFTAFTQRSPKYLDPASSYSSDETPYTYSIYQPLYQYHYLNRPYQLVPAAAAAIAAPRLLDAQGNELAPDAPAEQVAQSVYDIPIKSGIRFAPHPAFARDEQGNYRYHSLSAADLDGIRSIPAFEHAGTRELT